MQAPAEGEVRCVAVQRWLLATRIIYTYIYICTFFCTYVKVNLFRIYVKVLLFLHMSKNISGLRFMLSCCLACCLRMNNVLRYVHMCNVSCAGARGHVLACS